MITLQEVLLVIISGGSGPLVYWLMENVNFLKKQRPDYKRFWALGLSAMFPVLAWFLFLLLGYGSPPATWQGWIETMFALAAPAILGSQGIHAVKKMRPGQ